MEKSRDLAIECSIQKFALKLEDYGIHIGMDDPIEIGKKVLENKQSQQFSLEFNQTHTSKFERGTLHQQQDSREDSMDDKKLQAKMASPLGMSP